MKYGAFLLLTILLCAFSSAAQQTQTSNDDLQQRMRQMESEMQAMRDEINKLKGSLPANQTTAVSSNNETAKDAKTPVAPETAGETATAKTSTTANQPAAKQLGADVGSARVTPYGTIYFNAFGNSGGTNNADVPLFAAPTGAGNASASVRQTRLGLRVEGARVGNARLSAILEADFFGGFPSVGIGENFGVVRIRLANARLDWEKTAVTIGQDWMPFAPVNPTSIAAAAIPQMAAAGNVWARIPQIRVDRKLSDKVTLTGAVLAPQTGDYPATSSFFFQPNSGAAARVPFFQSRIAFADKNWLGAKKTGSVGLSGHYGRSRVLTGVANVKNEADSFGAALDWNFPLHTRVSLAGEAFFGRDLGGFQAGIFQGLNNEFAGRRNNSVTPAGVRGIGTRGGWVQLGFTPDAFKDRLTVYGSIGVDDPRNEDLTSISRFNFRARNPAYAFNWIYKFTAQFQIGAEFRRFETQYFATGKRINNHVNLGAAYSF